MNSRPRKPPASHGLHERSGRVDVSGRTIRYLVTGAAGFIGSALVRHIIGSTTHEVVVVDTLTYARNLDSIAAVADDPRYAFICADIADGPRVRAVLEARQPDSIIHLAAETHVDRFLFGRFAEITH